MNEDVIKHVIKKCKDENRMCEMGLLIHEGGKEDALETYDKILQILENLLT